MQQILDLESDAGHLPLSLIMAPDCVEHRARFMLIRVDHAAHLSV